MRTTPNIAIRHPTVDDLALLLALEEKWPKSSRATEQDLKHRIERFPEGYFIAEDETGIIGSIIAHPYHYDAGNLTDFSSWVGLVQSCYTADKPLLQANALYIISGTSNKPCHAADFFNTGVRLITHLATQMAMHYVVAGALLPGYAYYLNAHGPLSAEDYVFQKKGHRFVDPLIERYRRIGFYVPNKQHVIANYFQDESSLNYSALVVKNLRE